MCGRVHRGEGRKKGEDWGVGKKVGGAKNPTGSRRFSSLYVVKKGRGGWVLYMRGHLSQADVWGKRKTSDRNRKKNINKPPHWENWE